MALPEFDFSEGFKAANARASRSAWDARRPPTWRRGEARPQQLTPRRSGLRVELLSVAAITLGVVLGVLAARLTGVI